MAYVAYSDAGSDDEERTAAFFDRKSGRCCNELCATAIIFSLLLTGIASYYAFCAVEQLHHANNVSSTCNFTFTGFGIMR